MNKLIGHKKLLAIILLGSISLGIVHAEIELLPEVAALIYPADLDEAEIDQNIYVGLTGIAAPIEADYMAIGKAIVLADYKLHQELLANRMDPLAPDATGVATEGFYGEGQKLSFKDEDEQGVRTEYYYFKYPCNDLHNFHCVDNIIANRKTHEDIYNNNVPLIKRYREIQNLSLYKNYARNEVSLLPSYQTVRKLVNLTVAKAVLEIEAGNIEEGLTLLENELKFIKKRVNKDANIISQIVAIKDYYIIYHVISELIDKPYIDLHNPKFKTLLTPLAQNELDSIYEVLLKERYIIINNFYRLAFLETFANDFNTSNRIKKMVTVIALENNVKKDYLLTQIVSLLIKTIEEDGVLTYDLNDSLNMLYTMIHEETDKERAQFNKNTDKQTVNQKQLGFLKRAIEFPISLREAFSDQNRRNKNAFATATFYSMFYTHNYVYRFLDINTYFDLVYLKYLIKKENISADNLNAFIKDYDQNHKVRYTASPIIWDANEKTLSTSWLQEEKGTRINDEDGEVAKVPLTLQK